MSKNSEKKRHHGYSKKFLTYFHLINRHRRNWPAGGGIVLFQNRLYRTVDQPSERIVRLSEEVVRRLHRRNMAGEKRVVGLALPSREAEVCRRIWNISLQIS